MSLPAFDNNAGFLEDLLRNNQQRAQTKNTQANTFMTQLKAMQEPERHEEAMKKSASGRWLNQIRGDDIPKRTAIAQGNLQVQQAKNSPAQLAAILQKNIATAALATLKAQDYQRNADVNREKALADTDLKKKKVQHYDTEVEIKKKNAGRRNMTTLEKVYREQDDREAEILKLKDEIKQGETAGVDTSKLQDKVNQLEERYELGTKQAQKVTNNTTAENRKAALGTIEDLTKLMDKNVDAFANLAGIAGGAKRAGKTIYGILPGTKMADDLLAAQAFEQTLEQNASQFRIAFGESVTLKMHQMLKDIQLKARGITGTPEQAKNDWKTFKSNLSYEIRTARRGLISANVYKGMPETAAETRQLGNPLDEKGAPKKDDYVKEALKANPGLTKAQAEAAWKLGISK